MFDILRIRTIFPFFYVNGLSDVVNIVIYSYNNLRLHELICNKSTYKFRNWVVTFNSDIYLHHDSERIIFSKISKNYDMFNENILNVISKRKYKNKHNVSNKITFNNFKVINNKIQFTIIINGGMNINAGVYSICYY